MAECHTPQCDNSRKRTSPEFLEEGRQEDSESSRKFIPGEVYDGFSYAVEYTRSLMFSPLISFAQSCAQCARRVIYPKSHVEDKLKAEASSERRFVPHSLLMSRLSLYDAFSADGGVPGYRFSKPSNSVEVEASPGSSTPQQNYKRSAFQGANLKDGSLIAVCAFSEDGTRFVICFKSGEVIVWDTDHGEIMYQTTELLGLDILAVSFVQSPESVIHIITRDCKSWRWELLKNGLKKEDMSAYCRDIELANDQVELHTADFFDIGSLVVCSSTLDYHLSDRIELVVAESTHFPMFESHTKLEANVSGPSIVSGVEVSPDKRGLLVGTSLRSMKTGVLFLWPSFKENSTYCKSLNKGTLGSWSFNSDLVVTWTVPDGPKPEENDGSSAFVWNVKELRDNMDNESFAFGPTIVLKSPFGEKVLWCRLASDLYGNDRLIMALIGTSTSFLFWDVHSETHTHTIATEICTKDMPLASTKAWKQSRVQKESVKGLSPMALTTDRSKFGAVLGNPSQVLIYDAVLGIQSLKLTPQQFEANEFVGGADIMFSQTNGKIAMVGQHSALVFAPATHSRNSESNKCTMETPMIELDTPSTYSLEGADYKLLFSGDGDTLGLLSIGLGEMQVYHLAKATTCTIELDPATKDDILDFCLSMDGQYLVTSTSREVVHVWGCANEKGEWLASIKERLKTIALGITPDTNDIIVCSQQGALYWYTCSTNNGSGSGQNLNTMRSGMSPDVLDSVDEGGSQKDYETDEETPLLRGPRYLHRSSSIGSTRGMDPKEPSLIYSYAGGKAGSGVIGCRISANCETAVRVLQNGQLQVWNLKEQKLERTVPFTVSHNLTTISQDLIPLSGVAIPQQTTRVRHHSCDSFDQFRLGQEKTVLPEREGFLLTNNIDNAPASVQQQTHAGVSTPFEESLNEDLSSVYIVNLNDCDHPRTLTGRNLDPKKGLALSADGRHLACLAGKFASKIVVWSAYASQDLLPDYHSLSLLYEIKDKAVVKRETQRLLRLFGANFFNFQPLGGRTVLHDAVSSLNRALLCSILDYGLKHRIKVSLLIPKMSSAHSPLPAYHNTVEASLMRRSPKIVEVIMDALLKRVTHEAELSSILSRSLIHLHNKYPEIFQSAIKGSHVFNEVCKIEVSENLFDPDEFLSITSPCLSLTESKIKKAWESEIEKGKESVALTASALVFPFYNACKFGRRGLLRYLLLDNAHHSVFGSFVIRAIVNFKWRNYARKLLLQELIHHCLVAIGFTIYCFFLHQEETFEIAYEAGNEENSIALQCTLLVCWILAFPCLLRELNQCTVYSTRHQWAGFVYWLKSGWNWMEVLSYFNIVVVIPLGHFVFANTGYRTIRLSVMAATESLLLWSRMLFYARPFRPTGPFVIVISSLASTIMPFLLLAFCVMFGFALAFHILYRHVREINLEKLEDESPFISMHGSFHTLENTLFTTFGFLFGEFETDDLYYAPNEPAAMLLFALYMVAMSIILLNMLIALMGERFEKIQKSKETRFTEARAKAVDDVDSMLSRGRKRLLKSKIDTFLHVIVPSFSRKRIVNNLRVDGRAGGRYEDLESRVYQALKTASIKIVSELLPCDSLAVRSSMLRPSLQQIDEHGEDLKSHEVDSDGSVHETLDADIETE